MTQPVPPEEVWQQYTTDQLLTIKRAVDFVICTRDAPAYIKEVVFQLTSTDPLTFYNTMLSDPILTKFVEEIDKTQLTDKTKEARGKVKKPFKGEAKQREEYKSVRESRKKKLECTLQTLREKLVKQLNTYKEHQQIMKYYDFVIAERKANGVKRKAERKRKREKREAERAKKKRKVPNKEVFLCVW